MLLFQMINVQNTNELISAVVYYGKPETHSRLNYQGPCPSSDNLSIRGRQSRKSESQLRLPPPPTQQGTEIT